MKKYNSNSIYFGDIIYNTDEGYYYTLNNCFEKLDENTYKIVGKDIKLKTFTHKTNKCVTCANLLPLSILIGKHNSKILTRPMIELYKLKYITLRDQLNSEYEDNIIASNKQNWLYRK